MKYKEITIHREPQLLKGKSDAEIAKLTGFSAPYINMLRKGKRVATMKTYWKIKKALTKNN